MSPTRTATQNSSKVAQAAAKSRAHVNKQNDAATLDTSHFISPDFALSSVSGLQMLQRTVGNRAVRRLIQTKLNVGSPGDKYEKEADKVAEHVMQMPVVGDQKKESEKNEKVQGSSVLQATSLGTQRKELEGAFENNGDEQQFTQCKLKASRIFRSFINDKKELPTIQKAESADKSEPDIQKKIDDKDNKIQKKSDNQTAPSYNAAMSAINSGTSGAPLNTSLKSRLEHGMNADFDNVRVHNDSSSQTAAESLNARAFTHKNDIWLGKGESQSDVRLMAHEAMHVVQQGGTGDKVQREGGESANTGAGNAGNANVDGSYFLVDEFQLPPIKSRHRSVYQAWASSGSLWRKAGYDRSGEGDPKQQSKWLGSEGVGLPKIEELQRLDIKLDQPVPKEISINGNKVLLPGDATELKNRLKLPNWDREGKSTNFQVDHIVELQVAGWPAIGSGNTLENMELLDQRSNASAGGATRYAVRDSVEKQLINNQAMVTPSDIQEILNNKNVKFRAVSGGSRGRRSEGDSRYWARAQIQAGEHLQNVQPIRNIGQAGNSKSFALISPSRTTNLGEFDHEIDNLNFQIPAGPQQRRVAGISIKSISLKKDYTTAAVGDIIGQLIGTWDLPAGMHSTGGDVKLDILSHSQYAGYLGDLPGFGGNIDGASPVVFSPPQIEGNSIVAQGLLTPTVPLLGKTPISLRIHGRDIMLAHAFNSGQLSLPVPGLTIYDTSLLLYFGTKGIEAEGAIDFGINKLGSGRLTASITSDRGFEASGKFNFDTKIFDRAEIEIWYRNGAFGGSGTIGIDKPDKIRGIRSAEITASYDQNVFSASGQISPSIPGVQQAGLSVNYSKTEGLVIGGNLQLKKDIPGIRSGSVDVTLRKREDGWKVRATGTAQPAIPGINSQLTISYDDGAFTAQGKADYNRGMLSGSIELGATNRVISPDGKVTNTIGNTLRVFGGGRLTLKITPWLQATAGVIILPNAELEIQGEIGLPNQIEIFKRKQIDKNIFNIAIQIPIIPGIVAEIGGGLSAEAGIGPGVIDQLKLSITYNPSHEENTHVVGDGHLNIPADAGLRLAVRAGIGLGIIGASATGGLEIGGRAGIAGAAQAGVHVDWKPKTGLKIDSFAGISAEPKFKFDISGYVNVKALGFSIYDQRWQFAAVEFGSGLRFGVKFPIHYVEGKPFNLSLNDVVFEIPNINPEQILKRLIDKTVKKQ
jgi:hypothetical protein